jgi:hypothetical protein
VRGTRSADGCEMGEGGEMGVYRCMAGQGAAWGVWRGARDHMWDELGCSRMLWYMRRDFVTCPRH